jgi:hypothetical protein
MKNLERNLLLGKVASALCILVCFSMPMSAATWYVDSTATGSNNGTSWANAWTSLNSLSGISAGDTVYISGGPTGTSQNYTASSGIPIVSGSSSSARTTYQIGQDSLHNGTAIINLNYTRLITSASIKNVNILGDAGDGQMHFNLTNCGGVCYFTSASYGQYIRIAYVNFNHSNWGFKDNYPTGVEFDHNYLYKDPDATCDYFFTADNPPGGSYGVVKIHHNTIYLPRGGQAAGLGDDGITGASGYDINDNFFIGYSTSYSGSQHQDGIQWLYGEYVRIFNNTFVNMANSCVFPEPYYGNISHVRVYNNILTCDNSTIYGSPMRGVDINSGLSSATGYNYSDVVVANNLIVDLGGTSRTAVFAVRMDDSIFTFSGCIVANNISINSSGFWINSSVSAMNNVGDMTTAQAQAGHFVSYTPFSSANDFRLLAGDATFQGKGANLSAYFTTDRDGAARPATGAWSIGPYVSAGSVAVVTPSNAIVAISLP